MIDHQKLLLTAVSGADSSKPINAADLQKSCGIKNTAEFESLCERLYESRLINRCLQTKGSITQYLYWPTAIINKPEKAQFVINRPKMLAARRQVSQKKPIESAPKKVESMKKTSKKSDAKYTATLIVKTVLENEKININDLVSLLIGENKGDHAKVKCMIYYCLNYNMLSKDSSKRLSLGSNDAWLIKNGFFENGSLSTIPLGSNSNINSNGPSPFFTKKSYVKSEAAAEPRTTDALDEHLKSDPESTETSIDSTQEATTPDVDTVYCINKLFELLPNNCGFGLQKLADGNMHIKLAIYDKTYLPEAHEVESCINAIKTLTQFEVAN